MIHQLYDPMYAIVFPDKLAIVLWSRTVRLPSFRARTIQCSIFDL